MQNIVEVLSFHFRTMRTASLLTSGFALVSAVSAGPVTNKRQGSNPGVDLANKGTDQQTFWFCENAANGDGWADPGVTGSDASGCSKIVTSVVVEPSAVGPMSLATYCVGFLP